MKNKKRKRKFDLAETAVHEYSDTICDKRDTLNSLGIISGMSATEASRLVERMHISQPYLTGCGLGFSQEENVKATTAKLMITLMFALYYTFTKGLTNELSAVTKDVFEDDLRAVGHLILSMNAEQGSDEVEVASSIIDSFHEPWAFGLVIGQMPEHLYSDDVLDLYAITYLLALVKTLHRVANRKRT